MMGRVDLSNVEEVFTYHKPEPDQIEAFEAVRAAGIAFARAILEHVPDCADRSTALRKVREARMDANAAIALRGMI